MNPYLYRILVLAIACTSCYLSTLAQGKEFQPSVQDAGLLKSLYTVYQQRYQQELKELPSRNRKDFEELYADRWKNISKKFDKQEIYTAVEAQQYLDKLVREIVSANPMPGETSIHCYFSRSYIPNASYIGEGIILFNMGLFDRLDDESQVVFILCHEIAHYILRHQENSMEKYVTTMNSEEVQSKLRKIKGTEYHKKEQLDQLVKGLTFDSRRHSRDHEAQADSMGVELMRHTSFDLSGALTALSLLDGIDKTDFDTEASLLHTFNSTDYPFKKKWLHKEEGLFGGHAALQEEELADSLKTHPSCKLRIKLLTPMVVSGGMRGGRADPKRFDLLKGLFRYEVIEYSYACGEYSESLFLSLELLQQRGGDGYLIAQTGRLLNELFLARKNHTFGRVADLPSPEYSKNYNLLLQWLQNLYIEDLAAINYYFLGAWHPQLDSYSLFKQAYDQSQHQMQ